MPFLSICIPAYNAANFIGRTLESILHQTVFFEIEVLIIDDGSTDSTKEIICDYAKKDNRIRLISRENKGVFYTRLQLIDEAKGTYILFCDADDDYANENVYEVLYNYLSREKYDILLFAHNLIEGDKITQRYPFTTKEEISNITPKELYEATLAGKMVNYLPCKVIKRDCFDTKKYSSLWNVRNCEDKLISFNCIKSAKSIAYLPQCLYNYYYNPQSITRSWNSKRYSDFFTIEDVIYKNIVEFGMDDAEHLTLYANGSIKMLIISSITEILLSRIKWAEKIQHIRNIKQFKVVKNTIEYMNYKSSKLKYSIILCLFKYLF